MLCCWTYWGLFWRRMTRDFSRWDFSEATTTMGGLSLAGKKRYVFLFVGGCVPIFISPGLLNWLLFPHSAWFLSNVLEVPHCWVWLFSQLGSTLITLRNISLINQLLSLRASTEIFRVRVSAESLPFKTWWHTSMVVVSKFADAVFAEDR